MSADIFISFASQDAKIANTICAALEGRGFRCWVSSRDILAGENFQSAIVRAIRTSRILLLVFTSNSNRSDEMTKELALASQQKLMVVPLRVEDVTPSDAFAYEFATRQWIDLFADWEQAMNQLCTRIGAALANEPHSTEPIVLGKSAEPVAPQVKKPEATSSRPTSRTSLPASARNTKPMAPMLKAAVGAAALIAVAAVAVPLLTKRSAPASETTAAAATAAAAAPAEPPKPVAEPETVVAAALPAAAPALPTDPASSMAAPAPAAAGVATSVAPEAVSKDLPKEPARPVERKKRVVAPKPSSNVPY